MREFTRQEISDATGFDHGEPFESADELRDYFTVKNMTEMYGGNLATDHPELCDQNILDDMCEIVLYNQWHYTGKKMYMNPVSGHVQSLDDWKADYHNDDPETWPGVESEDDVENALVQVKWNNATNQWEEV